MAPPCFHLSIPAHDLAATRAWYERVLGCVAGRCSAVAVILDLGAMVKERCGGWQLWLLSGNPRLSGALRMKASRRIPVSNGGIDCRWLHYEIR